MDLAGKYLRKKELLRFSLPSVIRDRIIYLTEVIALVDKNPYEFQCQSIKIHRKVRPDLKPSFHLLRYLVIELLGYYRAISQLFSNTKHKDALTYPPYYNDGTLKGIRHVFGHPEMEYSKAMKYMNQFEHKYGIYKLIEDFNNFDSKAQKLIIKYNNELVVSRISGEDKKEILRDYPNSKAALLLKRTR